VGEVVGQLSDPAKYSLLGSGKRVRSSLSLAVSDCFSIPRSKILPFAAAVELIHAASLIHDDLPCLDNDDLRRGKPSCHKAFGEGYAVIAGDYLLGRAFSLVVRSEDITAEEKSNLVQLLAFATEMLCEGQVLDINAQYTSLDSQSKKLSSIELRNELIRRHSKKTGALIEASVVAPLYLISCIEREKYMPLLSDYGKKIGLLFQVVDDILDQTASVEEMGKLGKSDTRLGIYTYVSVLGLEGAIEMAHDLADEARCVVTRIGIEEADLLDGFIDLVVQRI